MFPIFTHKLDCNLLLKLWYLLKNIFMSLIYIKWCKYYIPLKNTTGPLKIVWFLLWKGNTDSYSGFSITCTLSLNTNLWTAKWSTCWWRAAVPWQSWGRTRAESSLCWSSRRFRGSCCQEIGSPEIKGKFFSKYSGRNLT